MICKYYLMIGSDTVDTADNSCIDVSRMIANISDIKTTYTRVDLGGVVRKCGSTMEFVEEARERFISLYNKDKLKSLASFAVYGISNNWTYNKLFECPHDFSTFKYDSYRARIGCIDNSAAALIKANKDFELVVIPGAHHTMGEDFGEHKRYDFFVRHLMQVNPPKWDEIK